MTKSFQNLDNSLHDWGKGKVQKKVFSRQSSRTNPNIKLVLKLFHSEKPLLCPEFNKPYKQNVYDINLLKKIQLSSVSKW